MLTERSIINFLVWIVGMIGGPYLAISLVEWNFIPAGVVLAVCALAVIFGWMRDAMCVLPLIGTFIAGKFMIIPVLHPAPTELFPLALIVYYSITYLALQRKQFMTGPLYFFIPITIIALIMLYHEHSFGLRSAGGGREGGRGAVFILVAALAYLCGVSVKSPSPRFLSWWTPLFCVIAATLSAIPYVVTTYFPGTAPYFYIFTDNINGSAYSADVLDSGAIVRNYAQGSFGATVVTFLIAFFPPHTWWRPHRWWIILVSIVCVALVVMGGYRSFLAEFGLAIFVALWCHYSWRALLTLPVVLVAIFLAAALQTSHVINLPLSAQRSLAFVPGDWDPEVVADTNASNDFRANIEKVYLREDAHKAPLLGNGLSYDSADFDMYNYLSRYHEQADGYYNTKVFTTGKMFHTGWISLYDAEGIIGFGTFIAFTLSLVWITGRMALRRGQDHQSPFFPLKVWMFCNIFPSLVAYFTVFGDFKASFPLYCFYAILCAHVIRLEKYGYWGAVPVREVPFDPSRTELSETTTQYR